MPDYDAELNAIGLPCPLPVLRIRKALQTLEGGQTLYVVATDPDSLKDVEAFTRITEHELLEAREEESTYHFVIRKGMTPK
ncbi:sulfurtransferase TusA family protein [Nitrosococcus watsonii]|uniref:SirA family protein n=1 Tax=Nitrosococcus watsoni (strain C-113) TaxID=105559 RepID=D8KAF0_NITWC|nr:sulfurtransferase TusA family protein [Nitrosococcus watsonii]ADJ27465.1 SirA family protein [Nitrosococcus watsonii C-113]